MAEILSVLLIVVALMAAVIWLSPMVLAASAHVVPALLVLWLVITILRSLARKLLE